MNQESEHILREERYRKAQVRMVICFCILIVGISVFLSLTLLSRFNTILQGKVATLVSADTRQLELNINSYLEKIETTATLLFSDEIYFTYDATDPSVEKYDQLRSEEIIGSRITDLGIMENFSDFVIVYSNEHTVGWLSKTTQSLFPDGKRYDALASQIVRSRTEDGWFFGINGNTDRLYYVKRLNPNAVLLLAFYSRELENVFVYPEELSGMSIRLTDQNNRILFSSDKEENGKDVPEEIIDHVAKKGNKIAITDENVITTNICQNNWKVVCTMPLKLIMKESRSLRNFTIAFAVAITVVFVVLAVLVFHGLNKSMDGFFTHLTEKADTDQLSGLLNKISYGDQVQELLNNRGEDDHALMVVLDVDFFKPINDNLGHARGDVVIATMGKLLSEGFTERFLIGRIGGDEFSVCCIYPIENKIDMRQMVDRYLSNVRQRFLEEFSEEHRRFGTSMSAGVVLMEEKGDDYQALYKKADSALYISKENGKGRTSWYGEENQ